MTKFLVFSFKFLVSVAQARRLLVLLKTKNYQLKTFSVQPFRGFTLIETFVAITILLSAIAGPLTIASKGLSSAFIAKDQTVASYLAQEGVEYIRWKRDGNSLSSRPWLTGLAACTDATCYIDSAADTVSACSGSCPALRYNATSGFYTYNASDPATAYTRTIRLTTIGSDEVHASVTITWFAAGSSHSFFAVENMFNWE